MASAEEVMALAARIMKLEREKEAERVEAKTTIDLLHNTIKVLQNKVEDLELEGISGTGSREGKKGGIIETKAFSKLEMFKGKEWLRWKSKFGVVAAIAFDQAPEILKKIAAANRAITTEWVQEHLAGFGGLAMLRKMSNDMMATFHLILDGEPSNILNNCDSGFEVWRRLENRFNFKTKSKELNRMNSILNPETAKNMQEVLPTIEQWEEDIRQLDEPNDIKPTMKCALVSKICPKKLRDHIELHMAENKEYHEIKEEIIRVVESGLFGKTKEKEEDDKCSRPMEVDALENYEEQYGDLNYMQKGGYGKGKGCAGYGKGGAWGGYGGGFGERDMGKRGRARACSGRGRAREPAAEKARTARAARAAKAATEAKAKAAFSGTAPTAGCGATPRGSATRRSGTGGGPGLRRPIASRRTRPARGRGPRKVQRGPRTSRSSEGCGSWRRGRGQRRRR
jgi:hypothetical protein